MPWQLEQESIPSGEYDSVTKMRSAVQVKPEGTRARLVQPRHATASRLCSEQATSKSLTPSCKTCSLNGRPSPFPRSCLPPRRPTG
eukprot:750173-Hanusia_phi.AAC.2